MKTCADCGTEKPLADFYLHKTGTRYTRCKPCHYVRTRASRAARIEDVRRQERDRYNPDKHRLKHWRQKYGIGQPEFDRLMAEQGHVCAVCALPFAERTGRDLREPVIDHDHDTGEVRGVLHRECNVALDLIARLTPADLIRTRTYLAKGVSRVRRAA